MRAGARWTRALEQAQGMTAWLRTRQQRSLGLRRHRQWVALGSVAEGIRAMEAEQAQSTGHTGS